MLIYWNVTNFLQVDHSFVDCMSLKRRPFQLRNNCSWRFKPWLWLWSDECVIVQQQNVLRCLQCLLKFQNMKFFIFFHFFIFPFVHLFVCSFVRLFICSFVRLFICLFVHLFVCSFVRLFICSFVHLFVCSFVRLFIYTFVHSFVCSCVRLFICSFVHSFVCSFVHLFVCSASLLKEVEGSKMVGRYGYFFFRL
jgi:hypothetical protein